MLRLLMFLTVLLVGCTPALPEPAARYSGHHRRVCSPVDANGLEFELTRRDGDGPDRLLLTYWGALSDEPFSQSIEDPDRDGGLALCAAAGNCIAVDSQIWLQLQAADGPTRRGQLWWRADGGWHGASFQSTPTAGPPQICG